VTREVDQIRTCGFEFDISVDLKRYIILTISAKTMNMLYNKIENNMGVGVSAAILTGEVREAKQSTFNPLEKVPVSVHK